MYIKLKKFRKYHNVSSGEPSRVSICFYFPLFFFFFFFFSLEGGGVGEGFIFWWGRYS